MIDIDPSELEAHELEALAADSLSDGNVEEAHVLVLLAISARLGDIQSRLGEVGEPHLGELRP